MSNRPLILCDHGETRSGLPELLRRQDCDVELARLSAGDYQLSAAWAIERKSAADFASSLKSGRLLTQLQTMLDTFERVGLLTEGDSWEGDRTLKSPIVARFYQWASLQPRLTLLPSPSPVWSARILAGLARSEQFEREALPPVLPPYVANARTPADLVRALPGVGPANARKLLDHFGSLRDVTSAGENELMALIGDRRGAKLHAFLNDGTRFQRNRAA